MGHLEDDLDYGVMLETQSAHFFKETRKELGRALAKFPSQSNDIVALALAEETGEAVRAYLHLVHEGKGRPGDLEHELIQVAAMALRLHIQTRLIPVGDNK